MTDSSNSLCSTLNLEQEADAEEERRRRERERQRKESAMSIEETKDELQRQEQRLAALKEEKHQLFLQLKKVLNEEANQRRSQSAKEQQNW
jgi:G protein pathway suppressor 2